MERGRTYTVEEARALPPPTEEELAERRVAVAVVLADARRLHEAFVAAGGHVMSEVEWNAFWDSRWDDEEDTLATAK